MIEEGIKKIYIQHLKIAKELSSTLSLDFKDAININNVEIDASVSDVEAIKKSNTNMFSLTFYSDKGRGILALDSSVCEMLGQKFLGADTKVDQIAAVIQEFLALKIGDKFKELYEKHDYNITLDTRVQSFDQLYFNKSIELYNVIKMKVFDKMTETGTIFALIPESSKREEVK